MLAKVRHQHNNLYHHQVVGHIPCNIREDEQKSNNKKKKERKEKKKKVKGLTVPAVCILRMDIYTAIRQIYIYIWLHLIHLQTMPAASPAV